MRDGGIVGQPCERAAIDKCDTSLFLTKVTTDINYHRRTKMIELSVYYLGIMMSLITRHLIDFSPGLPVNLIPPALGVRQNNEL
jgi:hypothetical protein